MTLEKKKKKKKKTSHSFGKLEKLSAHAARIQKHDLLLSEPLTNFEPKPSSDAARQRVATLVHCRLPTLFGTDVEMLSALWPLPGQGGLLTAGSMNSAGQGGTEMLPSNPLEWSAQLFAVDFEM